VDVINQSSQVQNDATSAAAAGIEQITVSIGEVANHAASTREAAEQASKVSQEGSELSAQACATIKALAQTVKSSAQQVELLGEQSNEISRITAVIKDIAEQTNLLALNAAIEAARAGEQGRGFAVVADEVRKLAERTTQATREISQMIGAIQQETQKAVECMREGAFQVGDGVSLVENAERALQEIGVQMGRTLQMVHDITHSTAEQQNAMIAMAQSVEKVAMMTDQSVVVVTQASGNVTSLDQAVDRMNKAVAQYAI
jgi:aerotaxis receptor